MSVVRLMMTRQTILLVFVIFLASVALGDSDVVVLTDSNFDAELAKIDVALVEFYAPWCGHCKQLEPKYDEAASTLLKDSELNGVRLCKMDADASKTIAGKYGVTGFPTLKLFRNGAWSEDYDAGRNAEDIVSYMKKKAAVAVNKEITTYAVLKTLISPKTIQRTTLVGLFSSKDSIDFKYFAEVVPQFASGGLDVFHSTAPSVLEGMGIFGSTGSSIQLYRPNAKPFKVLYRGTVFKQQLKDWISNTAVDSVGGEYSPDTERIVKLAGLAVVRFIVAEERYKSVVTSTFLKELSVKFPKFRFAFSDAAHYKADVEAHCDKSVKVCVVAQEKSGKIYGMPGDFNEPDVIRFIENFSLKQLKQRVKSEAAPAPGNPGEVQVVVGTTFEGIVANPKKDVFIEFYAPWCGHCKALAPKFDTLAKELESEFDTLVIAKMDMTANDLPAEYASGFKVEGFPTLYFAPKGGKQTPIKFDGGREVQDMKKWISEKRSK